MFVAGIAILIAVVLTLLLSEDLRNILGLSFDEVGQIGFLSLLILLFIGSGTRRLNIGQFAKNLVTWVAIFGVVIIGYSYRGDIVALTQRVMAELRPGQAISNGSGEVIVTSNLGGSFEMRAKANNQNIMFLFDTGASSVVLTHDDARSVGIDIDALRYSIPVSTANGQGRAAAARLDKLQISTIERSNLRVLVAEPGRLDISLLGTSFLETLDSYTVRGSQLILRD